jgi:hypothetical protein
VDIEREVYIKGLNVSSSKYPKEERERNALLLNNFKRSFRNSLK